MSRPKRSLLEIVQSNWIDFLWIYLFVGVPPFLFGGFEFNQFGFGFWELLIIILGLGAILFALYVFVVYIIEKFYLE